MRPHTVSFCGRIFDLSHTFPQSLTARTASRPDGVSIRCILSCHCFTLSPTADPTSDYEYNFEGELRVFCPERYERSKAIFSHFSYALERATSFKVMRSKDNSGQINNLTVDDLADGVRYCMYFDVSRSSGDGVVELLLHVRSAYTRQFRKSGADFVKIGTLIDQKLGLRPQLVPSRKRRKK
jgi:hypothetical protein